MNLIVGNGLIGRHLYYRLRGDAVMTSRREIDLSGNHWELPQCRKAYICAGETSTEKCEKYPNETRGVNVEGTVKLTGELHGIGADVVFISSERVFDGSRPFRKITDDVCPTTEYGRQKAEAERALLAMGCTVIRFAKVLGWSVPLFGGWIEKLKNNQLIYPYSNMAMAPLPVEFAVEAILRAEGLCQVSALEDLSYDRIAYHICNYIGADMNLVYPMKAEQGHPNTTLESNMDLNIPDAWETIYRWCRNGINRGN